MIVMDLDNEATPHQIIDTHQPLFPDSITYYVCACVRVSETGGRRKQLDLEPSYAVSLATER